jgi:hypothetical protein
VSLAVRAGCKGPGPIFQELCAESVKRRGVYERSEESVNTFLESFCNVVQRLISERVDLNLALRAVFACCLRGFGALSYAPVIVSMRVGWHCF